MDDDIIINVEIPFAPYQAKAIIAESKEQGISPSDMVLQLFYEGDILNDDWLSDTLGDLAEKHNIPTD